MGQDLQVTARHLHGKSGCCHLVIINWKDPFVLLLPEILLILSIPTKYVRVSSCSSLSPKYSQKLKSPLA
jgi:hypothetical protein